MSHGDLQRELKEITDRIIKEPNKIRLATQVFNDARKSRVIKSTKQSAVMTHRIDWRLEDWQDFTLKKRKTNEFIYLLPWNETSSG